MPCGAALQSASIIDPAVYALLLNQKPHLHRCTHARAAGTAARFRACANNFGRVVNVTCLAKLASGPMNNLLCKYCTCTLCSEGLLKLVLKPARKCRDNDRPTLLKEAQGPQGLSLHQRKTGQTPF
eukprot:1159211-Pelagomonas_calceolata.AAC.13